MLTQARVFLASPSGLDPERKLFVRTVAKYNESYGNDTQFTFEATGGERVPGGVGRPQSLINREVRRSDYLIAVIWDRWGSATSENAAYSSGTQEELAIALECLQDIESPMRDIAVYFKAVDERQLDDAGPQLEQVIRFKEDLESSKAILFRTFDTNDELEQLFAVQLQSWCRDFSQKVTKRIMIPTLSPASPDATFSGIDSTTVAEHLERAQNFEERGLITQAEIAYAAAVSTDDRKSMISYAKFLRRTGRLEGALSMNQRVLELDEILATAPDSSAAERSTVLANMAVIRRKQRKFMDSQQLLEEAVKTAQTSDDSNARAAQAYALDNLGLTLRQLNEIDSALQMHQTALDLREALRDEVGKAKVKLNIGRVLREQRDLASARDLVETAIEVLASSGNELRTLANAYSTLGDIALAEVNIEEARRCYEECLRLNKDIGHSDGTAIAYSQIVQLLIRQEMHDEALRYAELCLEINQQSGNQVGIEVASKLIDEIRSSANR